MTEQVMGILSAEVDPETHKISFTGTLGAETCGASPERLKITWILHGATGKERLIEEQPKTLTERFNKAYDEDARREDEAFFRTTEEYYRRRFNAED
jgi:hypothetical protein